MTTTLKKAILAGSAAVLLVAGIMAYRHFTADQQLEIEVMEDMTVNLSHTEQRLTYTGQENMSHAFATETRYHWDVSTGFWKESAELTFSVRTFDNGDVLLFTRLTNPSDKEVNLSYALEAKDVTHREAHLYPEDDFEREHDPTLGVDPTSYPVGLFRLTTGDRHRFDLFAGKNYLSKERELTYEDGGESRLRELVDETVNLEWAETASTQAMTQTILSHGEDLSEQWTLIAEEPLFDGLNHLSDWQDYSKEHYKQVNKWYTMDGAYRKLPFSIEPFTELGYGRNLGTMREKVLLDEYTETKERYFKTMVLNSLTDLLQYRSEGEDVWKTEYTSTWLKNQWGTRAPFVDTRHNESIALFFIETADVLNEPELSREAAHYSRFLKRQVAEGNTIDLHDGHVYIADYEGVNDDSMTHASLNHILGEMNFLLTWYLSKGHESDLKLAIALREAVEHTGDDWIRENGDLWYQINPDLSFDGTDYPVLTLQDLLNAQALFEKADLEPSPVFRDMIKSKSLYAAANNTDFDEDIINMLEKQGYQNVLEQME